MEKLDLLQEITLSGPYIKKMTIREFLSYMDLNWSYKYGKQCNIVYNNKNNTYSLDTNNRFEVNLGNDCFKLVLPKIVMDNYKLGNYNALTYEIKKLIDKKIGRRSKKYEFIGHFIDNPFYLNIIENVFKRNSSSITNQSYDKKIIDNYLKKSYLRLYYLMEKEVMLEYLEQSRKESFKKKYLFTNFWYNYKHSLIFELISESISVALIFSMVFLLLSFIPIIFKINLVLATIFLVIPSLTIFTTTLISRGFMKMEIDECIEELKLNIEKTKLLGEIKDMELRECNWNRFDKKKTRTNNFILDTLLKIFENIQKLKENDKINQTKLLELKERAKIVYEKYKMEKEKIEKEVLDVNVILSELNESNEKTLKFYILREIKKIEDEIKELERSLLSKETTDVQCQRFEKVMTAMSLDNTTDKVIGGSRRPRTLNNN